MNGENMKKFKLICFGGGNALPKVVLKPLRDEKNVEITSVTSMVDSGGSTGALRKELNVLPPGDIRRHILALSQAEEWKKKLWNFRFAKDIVFEDGHRGHNFANVFIAGLEYVFGDFEEALKIAHEFMKVKGKCLPATLEKVTLFAELENGKILEGEHEIDVPKNRDPKLRIKKIWIEPRAKAYPAVMEEIEQADFVVIGPGDLYSSILPCFLSRGIKETLEKSKAKKIFISPAMTKLGETYGYNLEDFVEEVENYACELDFVIYNTTIPEKKRIEEYRRKEHLLHELVLPKDKNLPKDKFIGKDLLLETGNIEYDPEKVKKVLLEIFERWSK